MLIETLSIASVKTIVLYGGLAAAAAALFTPMVMRLAHWKGWVAHPQKDRWHSTRSVALMGGTAIFGAVALAVVAMGGVAGYVSWPVALAGVLLFATGTIDDVYELSPRTKLLVQVLAGALTVYGGLLFWGSGPFWLSGPLTFLWVIIVTNAFNLIDGMDGLAAGVGAIAAFTLALIAAHLHLPELAGLAAATAGAAAGFLFFNKYPARVFMGDGGSLFLGYALAALAIAVQNGGAGPARPGAVLVPAIVLAVPLFDIVLVTVLRVANGRPVTQGGTDHSMHRLVFLGLSEWQTVLFLYAVSGLLGAVAVLLYSNAVLLFSALVLAAVGGLIVLGSYISSADVYAAEESEPAAVAAGGDGAPPRGNGMFALRGRRRTGEAPLTFSEKVGAVMQEFMGPQWKRPAGLFADTLVVLAAFVMAHGLRFPGGMPEAYQTVMLQALPLVAGAKVCFFYGMGIYHRIWPRAGTPEMMHLAKAVLLTSALVFAGMHAVYGGAVVSASALFVDALLTGIGLAATRFGFRALRQYIVHKQQKGERVLVCGANDEGVLVLRFLDHFSTEKAFHPVGFLDDERAHHGHHVKGLPILGSARDLEAICEEQRATGVVVNTARHSEAEVNRIYEQCQQHGRHCYRVNIDFDLVTGERKTNGHAATGHATGDREAREHSAGAPREASGGDGAKRPGTLQAGAQAVSS